LTIQERSILKGAFSLTDRSRICGLVAQQAQQTNGSEETEPDQCFTSEIAD
jgi:hypothetical protein